MCSVDDGGDDADKVGGRRTSVESLHVHISQQVTGANRNRGVVLAGLKTEVLPSGRWSDQTQNRNNGDAKA